MHRLSSFALALVLTGCGSDERAVAPALSESDAPTSAASTIASAAPPKMASAVPAPVAPSAPATPRPGKSAELAKAFRAIELEISKEQAISVGDADVQLSGHAQRLLAREKEAASAVVETRLSEIGAVQLPDAAIEEAVREVFRAEGSLPASFTDEVTGRLIDVHVHADRGAVDRFVAVITLAIPCGSDDLLAVFERRGDAVERKIAFAANDYASIDKSHAGVVFELSPIAADGSYFVVEAHSYSWCTSVWHGIDFQAIAPSRVDRAPNILLHGHDSAWLNDPFVLAATMDGFSVRYTSWAGLGDAVTRPYVQTFRRDHAAFERIAPFVVRPEDAPAEWLDEPWDLASRMTVASATAALRPVHDKLAAARKGDVHGDISTSPGTGPGQTTVRLTCASCTKLPHATEFDVVAESGGFSIAAVR